MNKKIAIVCSEFNKELVERLYQDAQEEFKISKIEHVRSLSVPGAGEIPLAIKWLAEKEEYDGILALGVIIRGKTTHYDSLCRILEKSLWELQKEYALPIIFSILMVENKEQALERIEKGRARQGARTLIQMIKIKDDLK